MTLISRQPTTAAPAPSLNDQRASEILDSARAAFVEKGFDGASMQDLARSAGMSVGNFYRYFPSKAAIVSALITRDLSSVEAKFSDVLESPRPFETLRRRLVGHIHDDAGGKDHPLWAEITAAAARKPEIAAILSRVETEISGYFLSVFARAKGLSAAEAERRYGAHVALMMLLMKNNATSGCGSQPPTPELTALILRTIDHTLTDIELDSPKV